MAARKKWRPSPFQIILIGFLGVVFLGALLLTLPIATEARVWTPFVDSLFTSVSAVCVTGLVTYDTAVHWSLFGEIVILILIQIGGLGVVAVASAISIITGKKMGLAQRTTMKEALSAHSIGGIVRYLKLIVCGVFIIEAIGALVMMPTFIINFGAKGIWYAVFHSVSAFCNAGFDLLGAEGAEFQSLTQFAANPVINLTVMSLILIGGIGFLTWEDVVRHRWRFKKYRTQTKLVLIATAALILIPTLYFFFFEFDGEPIGRRILLSLFQSVTPRTAGFSTTDYAALSDSGKLVTVLLMFVGGSSGSTAGGIKITTFAVLLAGAISVFRKKDSAELMRRRVSDETVRGAVAVLALYITLFLTGSIVVSMTDGVPIIDAMLESASAMCTVGLSTGITPSLFWTSKLLLAAMMFIGRLGGITVIFAASTAKPYRPVKYPLDKIIVG